MSSWEEYFRWVVDSFFLGLPCGDRTRSLFVRACSSGDAKLLAATPGGHGHCLAAARSRRGSISVFAVASPSNVHVLALREIAQRCGWHVDVSHGGRGPCQWFFTRPGGSMTCLLLPGSLEILPANMACGAFAWQPPDEEVPYGF